MLSIPSLRAFITSTRESWNAARDAKQRRANAQRIVAGAVNELARQGFAHEIPATRKKRGRVQRVEFTDPIILTRDELWMPINLQKFPRRRQSNDLRDKDVLQSLKDRFHVDFRIADLPSGKMCLVARLQRARWRTWGISEWTIPPSAPPLAFITGMTETGEYHWLDLEELPHLLVAGSTGGGKSKFLQAMIYTLLTRNTSTSLRLWLVDMKGQEFGRFGQLTDAKSQHKSVERVASDLDDALQILQDGSAEIARRNKLMQEMGAFSMADLRKISPRHHAPRVVIIIDELASLTLSREKVGSTTVGRAAQAYLNDIASKGRAAEVFVVIATQHISKEVISGMIQMNFYARVLFSVSDLMKSQLIIEDTRAVGMPKGRMWCRARGELVQYQAPLITDNEIRHEVDRMYRHGPQGTAADREHELFVRHAKIIVDAASNKYQGTARVSELWRLPEINSVMPKSVLLDTLQQLERDGILVPPRSRNQPRRVAPAFIGRAYVLDSYYGLQAERAGTRPEHTGTRPERAGTRPEQLDGHGVVIELYPEHSKAMNE